MNKTQIKRLFQQNAEFVPITLAEAVVVNTTNIIGLSSLGITTLDNVLKNTLKVVGTNAADVKKLKSTVEQINTTLATKQDKLSEANAGKGITITEQDGVVKISANNSVELYKVVSRLPKAESAQQNTIYIVPSTGAQAAQNVYLEYISIRHNDGTYKWEQIGSVQTEVNLDGYVQKEEFNTTISRIDSNLQSLNTFKAAAVIAKDVTTSDKNKVSVNYDIPTTLYDKLINSDDSNIVTI